VLHFSTQDVVVSFSSAWEGTGESEWEGKKTEKSFKWTFEIEFPRIPI